MSDNLPNKPIEQYEFRVGPPTAYSNTQVRDDIATYLKYLDKPENAPVNRKATIKKHIDSLLQELHTLK